MVFLDAKIDKREFLSTFFRKLEDTTSTYGTCDGGSGPEDCTNRSTEIQYIYETKCPPCLCIFRFIFIPFVFISTVEVKCDVDCVFPFKFGTTWYNSCILQGTMHSLFGMSWCARAVNGGGYATATTACEGIFFFFLINIWNNQHQKIS